MASIDSDLMPQPPTTGTAPPTSYLKIIEHRTDGNETEEITETYSERERNKEKETLMQCSALDYKSFLDTVKVDLRGDKNMRHVLTN